MDVGGFPPHHAEKTDFIFLFRQRSQGDPAAIRGQPAKQPGLGDLEKRIGYSNGLTNDLPIKNSGRAGTAPIEGRARQFLRLARDQSAAPFCQGGETTATQAAETRLAMHDPEVDILRRKQCLELPSDSAWNIADNGW